MTTIRAYTTIEQSRKLAEILPLESADMYYSKHNTIYANTLYGSCDIQYFNIHEYIPCWSLAALLGVLKYPSLTQHVENKWSITDWTGYYPKTEYGFDNPLDACCQMILKLHEQNLL